ncbi:MAG TPA: glycosyltransferase [Candidatus Saccharimonadales bacterium]
MNKAVKKTKVTIGVLTYNHEKYIQECLSSVVSQAGDFDLRIIIVNDKSKDDTDKIIKSFIEKNKNLNIEYIINETNIGAQKSIYKILELIKGTKPEFWSYIEGDDKYLSEDRTQKHINLLKSDNTAIMSYNKLLLINQNSETITEHEPEHLSKVVTTDQLASQNHIGSFCATFYTARCFDFFDPMEFDGLIVYDWFFNIWMSRFGTVRLLNEYLSGYRQHSASVWSAMPQTKQYWELIWSIDSYNKKLDFAYDEAFQSYKRNLINQLSSIGSSMAVDLAILSEQFMSKDYPFSNGETKYILEHNNSVVIIAENKRSSLLTAMVKVYKQDNPNIASKLLGYDGEYSLVTKCIYATSTDDAYYRALPISNTRNTLLVFEIGTDEETTIGAADTTRKLKAIFNSMNFVYVVVHSEKTKQNLVRMKLCEEHRIALIPSSVSEKIYGKDKLYDPEQEKSYFLQINNLLRRCVSGEIQPRPPRLLRRLKMLCRSIISSISVRTKSVIKRNRFTLFAAREVVKLTGSTNHPKE